MWMSLRNCSRVRRTTTQRCGERRGLKILYGKYIIHTFKSGSDRLRARDCTFTGISDVGKRSSAATKINM